MNEPNASAATEKERSLAELGAALREAREKRAMSLDDLAAATCIRRNYLEDIEAGRFDHFKALVYARGFVRTCAETLEVPDLWKEYGSRLTAELFESVAATEKTPVYPVGAGSRVSAQRPSSMRAGSTVSAPARGFRQSSTRRNVVVILLLLVALAAGALAYNWETIREEIARIQAEQAETAQKNREAEQARLAEKKKAEEEAIARERALRAQAEQAAAEKLKPAEPEKPAEPAAPAKPALTVRATGKCWLRVRANRKTVLETVVSEGWEQTFDLEAPLDVVFGFGQNVTVSTNGTDFASPGKGRQHFEYQPDGTAKRQAK